MATTTQTRRDTPTLILDVAERLAQQRGFNGFSYADIASELEITTASLHYHYRSKAELGEALIRRYANHFAADLVAIDEQGGTGPEKLQAYAGIYADVLRGRRMCLCGMFAAEFETLPPTMQGLVVEFFDSNETWLARVLRAGQEDGSFQRSARPPRDTARMIISTLEGAMLLARPHGDPARFETLASDLVASLSRDPSH